MSKRFQERVKLCFLQATNVQISLVKSTCIRSIKKQRTQFCHQKDTNNMYQGVPASLLFCRELGNIATTSALHDLPQCVSVGRRVSPLIVLSYYLATNLQIISKQYRLTVFTIRSPLNRKKGTSFIFKRVLFLYLQSKLSF